jgi:hypothetical protein
MLGVCPNHPSLRGEGAAGRREAAGPKKPEAYSLESGPIAIPEQWVPRVFSGPRTTQMPADRVPQ